MTPADRAARADELAARVLAPLVLGGTLRPVRPFGPALALALGDARIRDDDLASSLDVARVRQARLLAPVDALPPVGAAEWALAAGLNDLLQATSHELSGPLTQGRHARLVGGVEALGASIPRPRDVGDALARHATFARVFELTRTDTLVSWWCGSARFRGERPPDRLLAWPEARRVVVDQERVPLARMAEGVAGLTSADLAEALEAWLAGTPLTDLAYAGRAAPPFSWSRATLSLVAVAPGRSLALRALARHEPQRAVAALARATEALAGEARSLAEEVVAEARALLDRP